MDTEINKQLDELLESRYHGAGNIAGIRYQIAYSLLRAFDLYQLATNASVRLEGVEDIDVSGSRKVEAPGFQVGSQYIQVKTSKHNWDWNRFAESKIISNFLPVWTADPSAELLVVTNFGYAGKLAELVALCQGKRTVPSTKLKTSLRTLCERAGDPNIDLTALLKRISFERIPDEELQTRTLAAIVRCFDLQTLNSGLFLLVLMTKFLDLAVERSEIHRSDLEGIRLFIQENIELGVENPAVKNGWIERLRFEPDLQADDYYEGSNARPGHIVAGLDAERRPWLNRIHETLQRTGTCVLRTASGQGKSTLLYRYAHEHFQPETTFIVKFLHDESMVGPIKQTILARRSLGLPILVLLDNVRSDLRFWHRLAAELAGQGVQMLATVREEDWFRYSGAVSAFKWEIVTPTLSLSEARKIYNSFQERNKVAEGVTSAEWAFEQVSERKLLIEFTYLITHGQMLAQRLTQQVRDMEQLNEDKAKLHILRLVSVAQMYDTKVPISKIYDHVSFEGDADSTITSLQKEYVMCDGEYCEGLHFVRSQHLASILHRVTPIENTICELISILDVANLKVLVSAIFSDSGVYHDQLLQALIARAEKEPLQVVTSITKALFFASETLYCRQNQAQFDRAIEETGSFSTTLLCSATLPFQTVDILGDLKHTLPDNPNMNLLSDLAQKFVPRHWAIRSEVRFLQTIIDRIDREYLVSNFSHLGDFLYWCNLPTLDSLRLQQFVSQSDWSEHLLKGDLAGTSDFLYQLKHYAPANYQSVVECHKDKLIGHFKLLSHTVTVEEVEQNVSIEFIVDETGETRKPTNEQAWARLRTLYKMFPTYSAYSSNGLYASDYGTQRLVDDSHKQPDPNFLRREIEGSRNVPYLQAVEAHYALKFVHEWQNQWFTLRRDLAALMTRLLNFFQDGRGNPDQLDSVWRDVLYRFQHVNRLPESVSTSLSEEQRSIDAWAASISNFLHQLSQADNESRRLMLYNLRDASKHLRKAQEAFEKVIAYTHEYFDLKSLNGSEVDQYEYLADVIDVRLKQDTTAVGNVRRYIQEQRGLGRKHFVESIHRALSDLEQDGFVFSYPRDRIVDFPLAGIYLGFEVIDFERVVEQMALISSRFSDFPEEYHFLYLIPLLDGAMYSNPWRISVDSISKLLHGGLANDPWALLPVEEPPNLPQVLHDYRRTTLPELKLVARFFGCYAEINAIRNTTYFLNSRLSIKQESDARLKVLYEERLRIRKQAIVEEHNVLTGEMREFDQGGEPEGTAWEELRRRCIEKFQFVCDNLNVDHSSFKPLNVLNDSELEALFGRYLNARYRPI